jgi:uncharacterized membrane protein YeaQ/YmgE (transglycosylase-associated protein family)
VVVTPLPAVTPTTLAAPGTGAVTIALTPTDLTHWLVLLIIAALAGLVVEVVRGGAVPLGPLGGIGAALIGAWLAADLLHPRYPVLPQPAFDGVALIPAVVGALILVLLFGMLGGSSRRRGY